MKREPPRPPPLCKNKGAERPLMLLRIWTSIIGILYQYFLFSGKLETLIMPAPSIIGLGSVLHSISEIRGPEIRFRELTSADRRIFQSANDVLSVFL